MASESDSNDLNLQGEPARSGAPEPAQESSPFDMRLDLISAEETASRAPSAPATPGPAVAGMFDEHEGASLDVQMVHNVFIALDKAVRARRLYQPNNPVYLGFLNTLKEALGRAWTMTSLITVGVEEHGFVWKGITSALVRGGKSF